MTTITVGGALKTYARNCYTVDGLGIAEIMDATGKDYESVRLALSESGVQLLTGGPHDTATCRHDHRLALEHASGRCQHPVTSKSYTAKQRREMASNG